MSQSSAHFKASLEGLHWQSLTGNCWQSRNRVSKSQPQHCRTESGREDGKLRGSNQHTRYTSFLGLLQQNTTSWAAPNKGNVLPSAVEARSLTSRRQQVHAHSPGSGEECLPVSSTAGSCWQFLAPLDSSCITPISACFQTAIFPLPVCLHTAFLGGHHQSLDLGLSPIQYGLILTNDVHKVLISKEGHILRAQVYF